MRTWLGTVSLMLVLAAATQAASDVPERFRVDLSFGFLTAIPKNGGGLHAIYVFPRKTEDDAARVLMLNDVSTTLNVSPRVAITLGMPFSLTQKFTAEREVRGGIGDVYSQLSLGALPERKTLPAVSIQVEGGAPSATLDFLAGKVWRSTGRLSVSKAIGPRFSVMASAGYTQFFRTDRVVIDPIRSAGVGIGLGITRASILSVQLEEARGGRREETGQTVLPGTRDLRAGVGITWFSRGRPRFSLLVSAAGLRQDPVLLTSIRFPLFSR